MIEPNSLFLFIMIPVRIWKCKWCNRDPRCKKLQLTDLLVSPVHHIMKIPLVVRDIETRTENENERSVITKVLEMKEKSLRKCFRKYKN